MNVAEFRALEAERAGCPKRKRVHHEDSLQISVVATLRRLAPDLLFLHIPNGGGRSKAEGARFKKMGVLAGAPDLMFVLPNGRVAFIELKAGSRATKPQRDFAASCDGLGVPYAICRSVKEVVETLTAWGVVLKGSVAA